MTETYLQYTNEKVLSQSSMELSHYHFNDLCLPQEYQTKSHFKDH